MSGLKRAAMPEVGDRPIYWKHERAYGFHYAVKQLHFQSKDSGLRWVREFRPDEIDDAIAGWADYAPMFNTNIWADIPAPGAEPLASRDGWQAEAETQAAALAERSGIDMLDDHDEFLADLEATLIKFAEWTFSSAPVGRREVSS